MTEFLSKHTWASKAGKLDKYATDSPLCWFKLRIFMEYIFKFQFPMHLQSWWMHLHLHIKTFSTVNYCIHSHLVNTLRLRQNGRHFPDDIFNCIFLNENAWISIKISLKFVPKGPINKIPALVQIMAWRRSGDKPLSESMMVSLPTHICVTRPQWVKIIFYLVLVA